MKIKITAIKYELVDGRKTGKAFAFEMDPKEMARRCKTEKSVRKKVEEYVARSGVFTSQELSQLTYNMKAFLDEWKRQVPIVRAKEQAKQEASNFNPDTRVTPEVITRLASNEVFVFGTPHHTETVFSVIGCAGCAGSVSERNLTICGIDDDGVVAIHMPGDDVAAQRVEQQILDGTFHRTGSKLGVIAGLG